MQQVCLPCVAAETRFSTRGDHTFAFWGPSRFVNLLAWKIQGLPFAPHMCLDVLNGPPPIVLSVYSLGPPVISDDGKQDTRHIPPRISQICKIAAWPSTYWPSEERMRAMNNNGRLRAPFDSQSALEASDASPMLCHKPERDDALCFGAFFRRRRRSSPRKAQPGKTRSVVLCGYAPFS